MGNLGFIGYSGAYPLEEVTPYLQEACRWMGTLPDLPAATFLVGHWNNGGMGCEQPMDVPDLYDLVAAMPGCDALGSSLRYGQSVKFHRRSSDRSLNNRTVDTASCACGTPLCVCIRKQ